MNDKRRHTKAFPCPLCGGWDSMDRGQGIRCHGYSSDDGEWCHCARDEHAGRLIQEGGGTYAHRMAGDCRCGVEHGSQPLPISIGRTEHCPTERKRADHWRFDVAFDYTSEGKRPFQVCRTGSGHEKRIMQRQPRDGYGWWADLEGVEPFLYHRDELLAAPAGAIVFLNEGEPKVEICREHGLLATCNPGGAGKWKDEYAEDLRDKHVVIIADRDEAGRKHAAKVAASLAGTAASVRTIAFTDLPEKADVVDFFAAGGTVEELYRRALTAPGTDTAIAAAQADLERDLEQAQQELVTAKAERDQARADAKRNRQLIIAVKDVLGSRIIDQQLKAPYCRLLIARDDDPRFAEANERPVPVYLDQIIEMNGGRIDRKTASKWLDVMTAENLGTRSHLAGPKKRFTRADGTVCEFETKRLALQIGPREGEAPLDLATYKSLMLSPQGPARRKERQKRAPIACPDHPNADLRREWYCHACSRLVGTDHVHAPNDGKVSLPTTYMAGKLSPAETVAVPPHLDRRDDSHPPGRKVSRTACPCGFALEPGDACHICQVSACQECGALVEGTLHRFCRTACIGRPSTVDRYENGPPVEIAERYAVAAGGD